MNAGTLAAALVLGWVTASIAYVYRWRGRRRWPTLTEFLRRSWPVFAPLNCLLYLATRRQARGAVLDAGYLDGIEVLRAHWPRIRDEAMALHRAGELDATATPGSAGYHDLGFRTFYKRGWRKFYLQWYGTPHRSARRLCPETVALLQRVPGIRAAMFSVLPPGAELTLHADPMACALRYHLGLETPEQDACFIDVDGTRVSWRNGRDFVFDETYPHFVRNDTRELRLILMCDVERPMHPLGRAFNRLYALVPRAMAVPNTAEDRRGAITALFGSVAPLRAHALRLKARSRAAYTLLKLALNSALVALALLPLIAALRIAGCALSATC